MQTRPFTAIYKDLINEKLQLVIQAFNHAEYFEILLSYRTLC